MRLAATALLALLVGCAAPQKLPSYRSPLVEAPTQPLTPEGRPSGVAGMSSPDEGGAAISGGAPDVDGEKLAATAREYLGRKVIVAEGRRFPDECTGLVRAVYAAHGVDLFAEAEQDDSGVMAIWRYARRHGLLHRDHPQPGDLVFFSETYDRNRDGRPNDGLTHVGIVDRVEPDGTVRVIHRVARGVVSYRMNVDHPTERADAHGQVLNDWLRMGKGPASSKFAGELFAGYGSIVRR